MSSEFTEATDSPGFLLWQVTTIWQRRIRQALEPFELTHTQFVLLFFCHWLDHQGWHSGLTQVQLAQHTQVDVNVASQVLRTLQKRGLIDRTPHPTDTRAKIITVTSTGTDLATRAVRAVEAADRAFFAPLGDASKDEMTRLMLRLLTGGSD